MALYLFVGRFFVDARQRANSYYVVTDRQIIIVYGLFSMKAKSLRLRSVYDLSLSEGRRGRGTIFFGDPRPAANYPGVPFRRHQFVPNFDSIENARQVYDLIRETQAKS